jgi:hypothetical protein
VKFSPALRWSLVLLLPLTLGWKLTLRADSPSEVSNAVVEFLARHQFSVVVTSDIINQMPVVRANSVNCRLLVAKISPLRDSKDQVQYLVSTQDRTFIVFRGAIYNQQPVILTIVNYLGFRLLGALGLATQIPPVLSVVSSCDAAAQLPWDELRLSD